MFLTYIDQCSLKWCQGYLAGSPQTDTLGDENSKIEHANRMALISDEIYEVIENPPL